MSFPALKVLAPIAVGITAAVFASGASAASTDVSANWAGYVASGVDAATQLAASYTNVSATWVEPTADCSAVADTGSTSAAFWVGLGGDSDSSQALEQTGTEADCSAKGVASYTAWYELVPAASVPVKLKVAAGDKINGSVHVDGTTVTVALKNLTRKTSFTRSLTMAAPDLSSAEWIAEAPSACTNDGRCQETALTNFGTAKFLNARATTSDGHTGPISDPTWTADQVTLQTSGGGDPFNRFAMNQDSAQATPSALSTIGGAFSVTYADTTGSQSTDPSGGDYPSYGGGGFGGGGGYSGGGGYFSI